VRNGERVNFNVANSEMLARLNGFDAAEALSKCFGKDALHRLHRRFGNVKRGFPQAEHLREAVAVVRVFVSDKDAVDVLDGSFDGGQAGQRFALAQTGVHEEAGALGFEQRDVARAAGRQYGYPQADRFLLNCAANKFSE
jgi:hypothetical protein